MTVVIHSATFKKALKDKSLDVPLSGMLTVMISGTPVTVDPIPVNYTDDADGCEEPMK